MRDEDFMLLSAYLDGELEPYELEQLEARLAEEPELHAALDELAATAALVEGSPAAEVADVPDGPEKTLSIEHPSGETTCILKVDDAGEVTSAALLRTARKLMDGIVYV